MIAGIGATGGIATVGERRSGRRRRPFALPGAAPLRDEDFVDDDPADRARIADALAVAHVREQPPAAGDAAPGATVTAILVGRHIAAAADRAVAMQARIGAAAVGLLLGASE